MPTRTEQAMGTPAFVADYYSLTRDGGHQVDWANVGEGYRRTPGQTVTTTALAAAGATSIAVSALEYAVPSGTIMDFGTWAAVTVTVDGAGAAQGATSIPVDALSGPIPSGTVLNFTGTGEFAVLTAAAAAAATSLTVEALDVALEGAETAVYPGGTKIARATANAAAAATSITVDELPLTIASGDDAVIVGDGYKVLPAGTVCGTLLGSGKISPRVASTNPATCILLTNAEEDSRVHAITGYGVVRGGVIYENLLPDATGDPKVLPTDYKTELNANGTGFSFSQYSDSSAA